MEGEVLLMSDKRMLIVPAELVKKIDENRGDMGQADFIEFLIDSFLKKETPKVSKDGQYVTREELLSFEQDTKRLLRSFLDFFVNYGLEIGKQSPEAEIAELTNKLQGLQKDLDSTEKGQATIRWK